MSLARIRLPGHPDALCDLVAEAIVDEYARRDAAARLRISVMGGRGALFIAGDVMSQADFDVAMLVRRTIGSLGVMAEVEPFIALETVVAERATSFGAGIESPVAVVGYATAETEERVPLACAIAQKIAKALHDRRSSDEKWFWVGSDAEVVVECERGEVRVSLCVEHGATALEEVRNELTAFVHTLYPNATVRVNEVGAIDVRGIAQVMGASGRWNEPYGSAIPSGPSGVGLDIHRAEKSGAWLARAAARLLVEGGSRAAMVRAVYRPGERLPAVILARDERGADLSSKIDFASMSLVRAREWARPNLHIDAVRWGFAGEPGLPWESATA